MVICDEFLSFGVMEITNMVIMQRYKARSDTLQVLEIRMCKNVA